MKKKLNVLIIDDVAGVRLSLESAFLRADHIVTLAADGTRGLEMALNGNFDVMVTDIWMPGTNGLQLLKRLAKEKPELRTFAITGGGPRMTMETASSLAEVWGAEQVFIKPFDEDALIEAIETGGKRS
jgi:DNA-binding NtrC family response regulator